MNNLIALSLSIFSLIIMSKYISKKNANQLTKVCRLAIYTMIIWCLGLIAQILFSEKFGIDPMYFDYFVYIAICAMPIIILFISKIYTNTKIKFKRIYIGYFIVPILTLLILWTNNFHHLFYKTYSIYIAETTFGSFFYIYTIYQYIFLFIAILNLLKYCVKNSGFFSTQSLLILLGISIPVVVNLLGTFKIISMTIYITPICFTFTLLLLSIAIFKFSLLETAPIALQKVVDRISDSYLVLNEEYIITDFNKTFLQTFDLKDTEVRSKNIIDLFENSKYKINTKRFENALRKAKESPKTQKINETFSDIEKIFTIEINNITSKDTFIGIIVLFKDITQHVKDMETIKNNQNMLVERERLASLGQMIGGIAHNLKTPIFSISGGLEGLSDLVNEYDESIEASQVTPEDMHAIANDMRDWISKMKKHIEYMSDVITAVKGQAVTFSEENAVDFTIKELFKHVDILMKHELKNAIINLNIDNKVSDNITLKGNMNGLVQVINNLISNAIYAYGGKPEQVINLVSNHIEETNMIEIKVEDFGCGLPKEIQNKLFKEMVTTKGKEGTGLGLFMSASNIRAQFNGNLTFETEENKGTTFIISIPIKQ